MRPQLVLTLLAVTLIAVLPVAADPIVRPDSLGFEDVYPSPGSSGQTNRAGLVIDYGEGTVETHCVEFSETYITGRELLERAGLSVENYGGFICNIERVGCPLTDCLCKCRTDPCLYWSYWVKSSPGQGDWNYSNTGAWLRQVYDGYVDGWHWGEAAKPPHCSHEELCGSTDTVGPVVLPVHQSPGLATGDVTPRFTWTAAWDCQSSVAGYNLEVTGTTKIYTTANAYYDWPTPLSEGLHGWRLRAYDVPGNYSAWTAYKQFGVDTQPPTPVTLQAPADGAFLDANNLSFDWSDSTDPPKNGYSSGVAGYHLEITGTGGTIYTAPASTLAQSAGIEAAVASAFTPTTLIDDGHHGWRVRAFDAGLNPSTWSPHRHLTVDGPPHAFDLIAPLSGTAVYTRTPLLAWQPSADPVAGLKHYRVEIGSASWQLITVPADVTVARPPTPLSSGIYTWTVYAFDNTGHSRQANETRNFKIQMDTYLPVTIK